MMKCKKMQIYMQNCINLISPLFTYRIIHSSETCATIYQSNSKEHQALSKSLENKSVEVHLKREPGRKRKIQETLDMTERRESKRKLQKVIKEEHLTNVYRSVEDGLEEGIEVRVSPDKGRGKCLFRCD